MKVDGKEISNWWLVGGAAGVVVIWFWYKQSSSSSPASSGATENDSGTDPVTGLPYSEDDTVDPVTGMAYLQEAEEYGSVSAAEAAVSSGASSGGYLASGYGDAYGGTAGYPTYYGTSTATTGNSYSSNAQWAQAVTAGLVSLGYSATDVSAALGLYFQDLPLTSGADGVSYLSIVQAAVAEYGPPPVGVFSIVGPPSSGGGTATTGGGTGTTATAKPTKALATPSGLSQTPYTNYADFAWSPVSGATAGYHFQVLTAGGANVYDVHTSGTHMRVSSLTPGTGYEWRVAADQTSSALASRWTADRPFTTKK